jgi:hypothetical protein
LALVKGYGLFIPLYDNDGRPVEPPTFQALQQQLLGQFGGLIFFPQPNEGFWTVAGVTYRDVIVIYRVLTSNAPEARRFFCALKEQLKETLQQGGILRDVAALLRDQDTIFLVLTNSAMP